jgi:AraC-like DNA-binding protein
MSVFAPMLGHLWRALESSGVDPREVIEERLYRPGDAATATRRVSFADYDDALKRGIGAVDDPAFAVRAARWLHPSHLGALGHVWLASPSLRSAMERIARLARMFNEQVQFSLTELPDRVRIEYCMLMPLSEPDMVGEAHVASVLQLCRMNFGPELQPVEATLTRPAPADPAPWLEHFGPVVRFGQDCNSLSLSTEDADATLTGSDPEMVAIHEDVIERYLLKLDRDNIVNRLRLCLIEELPSGRVTEDDMAQHLNISKRTLYRKLRENNESYRTILSQVRRDLASRYLRDRAFSMTEIAFLLGYNDTSAFSRAFRTWFGRSPTEAREQVRVT